MSGNIKRSARRRRLAEKAGRRSIPGGNPKASGVEAFEADTMGYLIVGVSNEQGRREGAALPSGVPRAAFSLS